MVLAAQTIIEAAAEAEPEYWGLVPADLAVAIQPMSVTAAAAVLAVLLVQILEIHHEQVAVVDMAAVAVAAGVESYPEATALEAQCV